MGTMRRPPAVPTAASKTEPGTPPSDTSTSAEPESATPPPTRPRRAHRRPPTDRPEGRAHARVAAPSDARSAARAASRKAVGRRFRLIAGWAAPAGLVLVALAFPQLRPGLASLLGLGVLLLLWFFLARTKTLSFQSISGLFALGMPWALVIAALTRFVAPDPATGSSGLSGTGARTVVAAVGETSLLLVPVLVLAVLRPIRVRGFSATDWLLVGLTVGLSFQAVEELARLTSGSARYGFSPLAGGLTAPANQDAGFAGRGVTVALITVAIGLAIAAWRHTGNPGQSPVIRGVWRTLAVLMPVLAWWSAVSAQAGWNAAVAGSGSADPGPELLPGLLRLGWAVGGHGAVLGPLLLVLFVVALLVDAVRLRNAAERGEDPLPYPFAPTRTADRWAGRLTGWAGTRTAIPVAAAVWLIAAGCAAVAYIVRDLVVVLVAPGRPSRPKPEREPRWTAIGRVRPAGVMVRTIRAEAMALAAGPDTVAARRVVRALGALGLVGVLVVVVGLAPHWAGSIDGSTAVGLPTAPNAGSAENGPAGNGPTGNGLIEAWLAGTLAAQASWWSALSIWSVGVLVLGALALLLGVAGPLDPALFGDRSIWLAVRMPIGDGRLQRIRSYLAVSSPTELVVDGVGAALSLLPERVSGRIAGPATGPEVRAAVRQFASAPSAFVIERRAAARAAGRRTADPVVLGTARLRSAAERPPIKLADGRLLSALSADEERLFVAELGDLARDLSLGAAKDRSAVAEYRARIYGDDERLVSLRPEKWSDGQNTAYGMVAATAFYDGRGSSWYVPDTLPESIRRKANRELDRRLIELATVVYYPANPFRALEITTNHPLVAQAFEERMTRLAIPGYVVLET
jgi:hypothetical protein